jgi:hypothetical protein
MLRSVIDTLDSMPDDHQPKPQVAQTGALRALLIQSGKKLLEVNNPLQKWGLAVAARRGRNRAAVAVARKLCVALWHVMMGHAIGTLDRLAPG